MRKKAVFVVIAGGILAAFPLSACAVPENEVVSFPVDGVQIVKNQISIPAGRQFDIQEGESVILGARLFPEGVTGGIHWQSSVRGIVEMSALAGPEITVTGMNGGRTAITVLARNIHNEVYVESECTVAVIPRSFFKWSYPQDGWMDLPALSNGIVGKINEMLVRTGETPVFGDTGRGLVLEGPGILMIGSVLNSPTNSPFDFDPVYDKGGALNFSAGPSLTYYERVPVLSDPGVDERYEQVLHKKFYPLWNGRARISTDYEILEPGKSFLRIQVNNNTLERNNASPVTNWLVAETAPGAPRSGTLSGVFDAAASALTARAEGIVMRDEVLANSFACLALPEGKVLIRGIRIEAGE